MIEQLVESKIATAVAALDALADFGVYGAWTASAYGKVKNAEAADVVGTLDVTVPIRSYEKETTAQISLSCTLALNVRADLDPTGAKFLAAAAALASLLEGWHGGENMEAASAALAVAGFSPSFFRFTGGGAPSLNRELGLWSLELPFIVRGYATT